jgi:protein-L-isoaspartate(D-aspartate) O-methyltransferase
MPSHSSFTLLTTNSAMNYEQARFNMIEQQIRPWEVLDHQVLSLLAVVRREDFVPPAYRALAFADMEIPLPPQQNPSQCMLAPKVEARILQDLGVQKHEKVLEIGTGSGYMAALLAHRAQQVMTLEIDAVLAETARNNLQKSGIYNAEVRTGDGAANIAMAVSGTDPLRGPFDVIVLSGSVAAVPPSLLALLKVGGRLSAIVGFEPMMRATLITRVAQDAWRTTQAWDTVAPRLLNFPEPSKFVF